MKTGTIKDLIKARSGYRQFGFISIGNDADASNSPTIYFNFSDFAEADFRPRKGYAVQFTVTQDEVARVAAKNVTLTAAGKVAAAEREKTIAERNASRVSNGTASPSTNSKPKARKPRTPRQVDPRSFKLKLTSSTHPGEKEVEAKMGESLGKLKHHCITAFGTEDITLQVYHADGRLLSKEILGSMKDGDSIKLAPKQNA